MKNFAWMALVAVPLILTMAGCKTTEKNYRRAYERTVGVESRDSMRTAFDQTVYGKYRRDVHDIAVVDGGDSAVVRTGVAVRATKSGGAVGQESIKPYCVVAGEFKQLFNARSLQQRLADALPGAFIVETREPYYYVVAASYADLASAKSMLNQLLTAPPFALRKPAPYILQPSQF